MSSRTRHNKAIAGFAVCVALGVAAIGIQLARAQYRAYQLRDRLAHIGPVLATMRVEKQNCASAKTCSCRTVTPSDIFDECRVIDGAPTLWVRSIDTCFEQWLAINRVWTGTDSLGHTLGVMWIARRPHVVAPGWSLLAVAPCLD